MKKLAMLSMLVLSLVIGGCSQTNQATESGSSTVTPKQQEKTKSDFPAKPIELLVPYAAGSSTEMLARVLAEGAEKYLPNHQSIVVQNKPGGAGTIAATEIYQAKPDGYKIGIVASTQLSIMPHFGKTIYTHDSFRPIIETTVVPSYLAVKSDSPWKTFEEWLDYVKKNPGKFTHAEVGSGSAIHVSFEALNFAAGVETKAVHFESGAQQVNALLGGHVLGANLLPQTAKPYVDSGDIRLLMGLGSVKSESFQDVPLLTEKGIDVAFDIYNGIIAPKGLPTDVQEILHSAFKQALEDPEVIEQINKLQANISYAGPEEFQKVISDSYNENGEVLKKLGLVK